MSTPRRGLLFSMSGTTSMHSVNSAITKHTAVSSSGPLNAVVRSVETTL